MFAIVVARPLIADATRLTLSRTIGCVAPIDRC
jgi:hypothetical protein